MVNANTSVTRLDTTIGTEPMRMPYPNHNNSPALNSANMPSEMSCVERVRQALTTCGTNAAVVSVPAIMPSRLPASMVSSKGKLAYFIRAMKTRSLFLGWLAAAALLGAAGVRAESLPLPPADESMIGEIHVLVTRPADTLSDIARAHHVGYDQIVQANPAVDPWLPGDGTRVIVPTQHILPDTPRTGLVLNLPEMRIYYYPPTQRGRTPVVMTFPVSVGRLDWSTPLGLTRIAAKVTNPEWRPPASLKAERADEGETLPDVFPPGPDNPLGARSLRLAREGYLIHGTNKPYGIGM